MMRLLVLTIRTLEGFKSRYNPTLAGVLYCFPGFHLPGTLNDSQINVVQICPEADGRGARARRPDYSMDISQPKVSLLLMQKHRGPTQLVIHVAVLKIDPTQMLRALRPSQLQQDRCA